MQDIKRAGGWALLMFAAAILAISTGGVTAKEPAGESAVVSPPPPPEHQNRNITTVSQLSRDLHDVVVYLEAGQDYFRKYQTGTHSVEENAAFLNFLEVYEKELELAKKEARTLRIWVDTRGSLEASLQSVSR